MSIAHPEHGQQSGFESDSEAVYTDLALSALGHYMNALHETSVKPDFIFFDMETTPRDDGMDEDTAWVKLTQERIVTPETDTLYVGIPIVSKFDDRPTPVNQPKDDEHFYVRIWSRKDGPITESITKHNALEALRSKHSRREKLSVTELGRKLGSYHLHITGIGYSGEKSQNDVA